MTRLLLATPLIYALLLTFASCGKKNYNNSGAIWGTTYNISYNGPYDLGDSIINVMRQVEDELSMFAPNSIVSQVNRGENPEVGQMFVEVFNLSQQISRLSHGAFDPTVGPLTNLWGFGYNKVSDSIQPTQTQIDSLLIAVGIADCHIANSKVIKKHPSTIFDFSSIAKGYGVDAVAAMLARNGCTDYLVEIGGEIAAKGRNRYGNEWRVQIDAPVSGVDGHISMLVIPLSDKAVATSGNYRNFRETSAGRIGHTIDPHTGRPIATSTASATVIAPDCATADALATACMVMPLDSALTMIEALPSAEAIIVVASADTFTLHTTTKFPKQVYID